MKRPKKQKRRQNKMLAEQVFLQSCLDLHKKALRLAMALDGLSVLLFIGQMYCLAVMIAGQLTTVLAGRALTLPKGWVLFGFVCCLFVRPLISFWREKILSDVGVQMAYAVKKTSLTSLGVLGLAKDRFGADGFLASVLSHEPDALHGYARFYVQKITAVLSPLLIATAVATKSLMASVILLLTAPLAPIFMALIGIKTAQKSREQMDALADLGGRFLDWLRGIETLVVLGATHVAAADIECAADEYKRRTMSVLGVAFLNSAVLEFLSALSIALVAVYLGFGLLGELPFYKGQMLVSYETALFILLLVSEFYAPLKRLGADYHIKAQALGAATTLAPLCAIKPAAGKEATVAGDILLKELSVMAEGRQRLSCMSLHIKQGQTVVIRGASGRGKSTLLAVLAGFSAYQGSALLGGVEIATLSQASLHKCLGYLPQTHALLPLSIADNLRLAKSEASDAKLQQVLQQVGLWSLVVALPLGMDTVLFERGGGLSGGQAQRLAIAQLLLQNATIWLLDEPTEHLDCDTKHTICQLLYQLKGDKTLIWVTHDSPVAWADQVYELGAYD